MYSWLAASVTVGCCIYASLTDLRERKIKNVCSFGLLYCGLILQLAFFLQGQIPFSYLLTVTLGGGALAYLSHLLHFFAAGDAKLFWAACVALPPVFFDGPDGYVFAPLVLGINTFVPYLVCLLVYALLKTSQKEKRSALQKALSPVTVLSSFFQLLGFIGVGTVVLVGVDAAAERFSISVGPVMRFLMVIGVYQLLAFWARAKSLSAALPILGSSVCLVALIYMGLTLPGAAQQALVVLVGIYLGVFVVLRSLILFLANPVIVEAVDMAALEVGMTPAEAVVKEESGGEVRYVMVEPVTRQAFPPETTLVRPERPLDLETIQRLKTLAQSGAFDDFGGRLQIQKTIPFAPFIALGVVLTVLVRGPVFSVLS